MLFIYFFKVKKKKPTRLEYGLKQMLSHESSFFFPASASVLYYLATDAEPIAAEVEEMRGSPSLSGALRTRLLTPSSV